MIYLDQRIGSAELLTDLISIGAPATITHLEYGDMYFAGNGPDPETPTILYGVERKRIADLAASITSKRLSGHQLPGMVNTYDRCYLVVEERFRRGGDGQIQIPKKSDNGKTFWVDAPYGIPYQALEGYLATLEEVVGNGGRFRVVRTVSKADTASWLLSRYLWANAKTWEEHRSHLAFEQNQATVSWVKANLTRRIAKELPRIGWERSLDCDRVFANPRAMVNAPIEEWAELEHTTVKTGKVTKLGMVAARAIVDALEGRIHVTKE